MRKRPVADLTKVKRNQHERKALEQEPNQIHQPYVRWCGEEKRNPKPKTTKVLNAEVIWNMASEGAAVFQQRAFDSSVSAPEISKGTAPMVPGKKIRYAKKAGIMARVEPKRTHLLLQVHDLEQRKFRARSAAGQHFAGQHGNRKQNHEQRFFMPSALSVP